MKVDLRGDGPCGDCGTEDNIIWSTDNTLWNAVIRPHGEIEADPFLCIPCFVVRVDAAGLAPTGWRLTPDWHWETHAEREARRHFPEERAGALATPQKDLLNVDDSGAAARRKARE